MLKEKGYDEFLAEKIRKGREDIQAGRVVTREELNRRMKILFAQLEQEQHQQDQELNNGAVYG